MSPPYPQLATFTPLEQLCKSCINKVNNQRCKRKPLCSKGDARKAEYISLVREFVLSWYKLSQEDRAVKMHRFAELSVCSKCVPYTGEIGDITDEQMQAFMVILFPNGVEQIKDIGDDNGGMEVLGGGHDGQQDGGEEGGDERLGNEKKNIGTGVSTATHAVVSTPAKPQEPVAKEARGQAMAQDQAAVVRNGMVAKLRFLLKALVIAVFIWVLIANWVLSPVVLQEILCGVFDEC